jgi:formate/nitrite transporter FocA (FNT family)
MVFQHPSEISQIVMKAGIIKAGLSWWQILVRGFISGCFLGFGSILSIIVGFGSPTLKAANPGLAKLLFGLCFPTGLALIVLFGAELFTGNTMYLVPGLLAGKIRVRDFLKNWSLCYLANFVGSVFFMGIMVYLSDIGTTDPWATSTRDLSAFQFSKVIYLTIV